jgi:hypothetical protein
MNLLRYFLLAGTLFGLGFFFYISVRLLWLAIIIGFALNVVYQTLFGLWLDADRAGKP